MAKFTKAQRASYRAGYKAGFLAGAEAAHKDLKKLLGL